MASEHVSKEGPSDAGSDGEAAGPSDTTTWEYTVRVPRFRGVRDVAMMEKASYYVFAECADGAYEAFRLEEAYNFSRLKLPEGGRKQVSKARQRLQEQRDEVGKEGPHQTDMNDSGSTSDEDGDRGEDPSVPQAWLKKNRRYALRSNSTKNDGEEDGYNLYKDEEDSILKGIDCGSDPSSSESLEDEEEYSLGDQTRSPDSSVPV